MGLIKRAAVAFVRPFYKALVERPLWWFLSRVKAFFFTETMDRLAAIETKLGGFENLPRYQDHFNHIEASNAAQWDALEQLLLAVLSQPRDVVWDLEAGGSAGDSLSSATKSFKANASNNLR
jgi:hypothetical protein